MYRKHMFKHSPQAAAAAATAVAASLADLKQCFFVGDADGSAGTHSNSDL
jgi:hypothetical protein